MEKLTGPEFDGGDNGKQKGLAHKIRALVARSTERRRADKLSAMLDLLTFVIGIVFARCHVIFGAHPLSIAFVAALPSRVFLGAIGSVIGAITLGKAGIIYAMITLIVVFLRIIVSEGEEGSTLFRENLLLRMCSSLIGGFVGAVYEVLLSGFTFTSVLFGSVMILFSPLLCFLMSGFLDSGYDLRSLAFSDSALLITKGKDDREKYSIIFFELSSLVFIFLTSISLAEYVIFGINLSYIAAAFITLITARRFGTVPGLAVGFAASFGLSGLYSVAFSLLGLSAGLLFPIGTVYALTVGGAVMCAWCAYTGGVGGFLTTLPEYVISCLLAMPIISRVPSAAANEPRTAEAEEHVSDDVLGLAALSYKNRYTGSLDALEAALSLLGSIVKGNSDKASQIDINEIEELLDEHIEKHMLASGEGANRAIRRITDEARKKCSEKLASGLDITASDLLPTEGDDPLTAGLAESVNRAVAIISEEKYHHYKRDTTAEDMSLISSLIYKARTEDEREKAENQSLEEKVLAIAREVSCAPASVKVFGVRRPCILIAFEDDEDEKTVREALKRRIESELGIRLESVDLYKRGKVTLLEARAGKRLAAECASLSRAGIRDRISGDTYRSTESKDARFYTMICDGMGSGREAREISRLASDILSLTLELIPYPETLLAILNHLIVKRGDECSVTVDLFSLDLVSGKGAFIKSGAAASYVKRGDSLYRIRSHTAPLGLMRELDSELVKVDVEDGDYVIMLSDGVSQNVEDSPWLYNMLSAAKDTDVKEFAARILEGAKQNGDLTDDMTVSVTKIKALR